MRFSIIIPVYNVEKYLGECIDSVLGQTFKDYEIILCDDGSTDGSGKICDLYRDSSPDGTVRVLHDANGGLAAARNRGIDAAHGDYILFLDSDDFYIENTFLQMLSDKISAEEPEVLLFGLYYYYPDGTMKKRYRDYDEAFFAENGRNPQKIFSYLLQNGFPVACAWNKCYRASYLRKHDLRFPPGVIGEDMEFGMQVYLSNPCRICCLNVNAYAYRQGRPGQITAKGGRKPFLDTFALIQKYAPEKDGKHPMKNEILSFLAFEYAILLLSDAPLSAEERKTFYGYSGLLSYATEPKSRQVYRLKRIFGVRLTHVAMRLYKKIAARDGRS